jgi:hypothetical protein
MSALASQRPPWYAKTNAFAALLRFSFGTRRCSRRRAAAAAAAVVDAAVAVDSMDCYGHFVAEKPGGGL